MSAANPAGSASGSKVNAFPIGETFCVIIHPDIFFKILIIILTLQIIYLILCKNRSACILQWSCWSVCLSCRMSVSQRCLCCVKYLMFVFNLIFWVSIFTDQSQAVDLIFICSNFLSKIVKLKKLLTIIIRENVTVPSGLFIYCCVWNGR